MTGQKQLRQPKAALIVDLSYSSSSYFLAFRAFAICFSAFTTARS